MRGLNTDLIAVRKQHYQLCHRAVHFLAQAVILAGWVCRSALCFQLTDALIKEISILPVKKQQEQKT